MNNKTKLSFKIIIYLVVLIIYLIIFYNYNVNKLEYAVSQFKNSFSTTLNLLANGLSTGYFRWDDFREAIIYENNELKNEIFEEIEYVFSPYILNYELRNENINDVFYEKIYDNNNFYINFSVYDSFDENMIEDFSVKIYIDYNVLIDHLLDEEKISFGSTGKPFLFGLKYKIKPPLFSIYGVIILIFILLFISLFFNYLDNKQSKITHLNNQLEKLLQVSLLLSIKESKSMESFLTEFFRIVFSFVPEANFGSVLLYKNNKWQYIDALGHDINKLKSLTIKEKDMIKPDKVEVIKAIQSNTKKSMIEEELVNFNQAVRKVKETLLIPLKTDKKYYGTLSLDIAESSKEIFKDESIELMSAFSNLVTSYFVLNEYSEINREFQNNIILSMINILELHDKYTKGHSENVAKISKIIAEEMGYKGLDLDRIYWSGLVHDIGKIVISYDILNKPYSLTPAEYEEIKTHPVYGHDVLTKTENLSDIAYNVLCHHERYDGKGYPQGLKEDEIPIFSKIICVADAYDAMTSERSYRKTISRESAFKEILRNSGTQFDPKIVSFFKECYKNNRF